MGREQYAHERFNHKKGKFHVLDPRPFVSEYESWQEAIVDASRLAEETNRAIEVRVGGKLVAAIHPGLGL